MNAQSSALKGDTLIVLCAAADRQYLVFVKLKRHRIITVAFVFIESSCCCRLHGDAVLPQDLLVDQLHLREYLNQLAVLLVSHQDALEICRRQASRTQKRALRPASRFRKAHYK